MRIHSYVSRIRRIIPPGFEVQVASARRRIARTGVGDQMKLSFYIRRLARAACCFLLFSVVSLPASAAEGYHLLNTYKFGAAPDATREYFDYIFVDSTARRVYVSHGTEILVLDADSGKEIGKITGLKLDHGVAVAHEFNRGFVTDGQQGKAILFDLKTLKVTGEAKADQDADGVIYDPATKRVFVMNGDPSSTTVIDAKRGEVVKTVPLGGSPEFAVADGKGVVYINLADKNEIAVLGSKTLEVKSRWPVAPEGRPTAMAMDIAHRRLFSAGRNPQYLIVMDADNGKVVQSFSISAGVDADAFDPETGLVFASTIEGRLHIFHEDSPDKFSEVETLNTEFGAKTMGLDTRTHRVWVDTADFSPAPAATAGQPRPRRSAIQGTFRVMVYGK